jgi:hypothetical protein
MQQFPKKNEFPSAGFYEKRGVISAFSRIFGQSFEKLKQLMLWENEKDIGKPTLDSWGHESRRSYLTSTM